MKLFYGECHSPSRSPGRLAPTRDHAGVCEFHPGRGMKGLLRDEDRDLAPREALPHDPVDSCVTNHRIVREQRADRSAPPRLAGQGARPSRRRPRPAVRDHGTNPGRLHGSSGRVGGGRPIRPRPRADRRLEAGHRVRTRPAGSSPLANVGGFGVGWTGHHQTPVSACTLSSAPGDDPHESPL